MMFIRHYSVSTRLLPISKINDQYTFSSGRTLKFIRTPYAHSGGSFVTFDSQSGILFSSDLFGSEGHEWELFLKLRPVCMDCVNLSSCPEGKSNCLNFHKKLMPSAKALNYALKKILEIPFSMIAPQHGSVIKDKAIIRYLFEQLTTLKGVGIDAMVKDGHNFNFGDLRERFK